MKRNVVNKKSILQLDLNENIIEEFESISEASRILNYGRSGIYRIKKKKQMNKILITTEELKKSAKKYHSGRDVKIGDYKIIAYIIVINKTYLTIINELEIGKRYNFIGYKNNVPIFTDNQPYIKNI